MMNDELAHIGVLGMKWGHKKASGWSSSSTAKGENHVSKIGGRLATTINSLPKKNLGTEKKPSNHNTIGAKKEQVPNSADYNKKMSLKAKKLNTMSNEELRSLNDRLQLERTYKQLTTADVSPGRKFVTDLLVNVAKQTVTSYVSKQAGKGFEDLMKKVVPTTNTSN